MTREPIATTYAFRDPVVMTGSPMDHADAWDFREITVDHRGGSRWAITNGHGSGLVWCERDGEWEWEPLPSNRDGEFLARCRYSLDDALRIAARLDAER